MNPFGMNAQDVEVYQPNEEFWDLWSTDKQMCKRRGFYVVKIGKYYIVLRFAHRISKACVAVQGGVRDR